MRKFTVVLYIAFLLIINLLPAIIPDIDFITYFPLIGFLIILLSGLSGGLAAGISTAVIATFLNIVFFLLFHSSNFSLKTFSEINLTEKIITSVLFIAIGVISGLSRKNELSKAMKLSGQIEYKDKEIKTLSGIIDNFSLKLDNFTNQTVYKKNRAISESSEYVESLTGILLERVIKTKKTELSGEHKASQVNHVRNQSFETLSKTIDNYYFELILEKIPYLLFIADLKGKIIFHSPLLFSLYGYEATPVNRSFIDFIVPDQRKTALQNIQNALIEGVKNFVKYEILPADNRMIMSPIPNSFTLELSGNPICVAGIVSNPDTFDGAYPSLSTGSQIVCPDFICQLSRKSTLVTNSSGIIIYTNEAFSVFLEYSPYELIGRQFKYFMKTDDKINPKDNFHDQYSFNADFISRNGKRVFISLKITSFTNVNSEFLGFLAEAEDITKRRQVEEALQRRLILEKLVTGISTRFINIDTETVDEEIASVLLKIGKVMGAYYSLVDIYEDSATVGKHRLFESGKVIAEKNTLNDTLTSSVAASDAIVPDRTETISIPIIFYGRQAGFFRFVQKTAANIWLEEDINLLALVGEIFVNTLTRTNTEQKLRESEFRFRSVVDNSKGWIWETDSKLIFIYVSQKVSDLLGYQATEIIGKKISSYMNRNEFGWLSGMLVKSVELGRSFVHAEISFRHKDNYLLIFESNIVPVFDNESNLMGYRGICTDVTDLRQEEEKLKLSEERFRITLHSIGDGVITTDTKGNIAMLNKIAEDLTGWNLDDAIGQPLDNVLKITRDEIKTTDSNEEADSNNYIKEGIKNVLKDDSAVTIISKIGILKTVSLTNSPIGDEYGVILGSVLVFKDITDKKQKEEEIKFLSFHDKLTGLFNRAFFEEEMKRLDTKRQYPLSIIIGDLNGLKLVNDVFGHLVGDRLLKQVADIIRVVTRKEDIVARWGGDELVILLPKTDEKTGTDILQRIIEICSVAEKDPIQPSISLGIATKTDPSQDLLKVLKEAEDKMYRHKLLEGKSIKSSIITSLEKTLYERSYETEEHAKRMLDMSSRVGKAVGLSDSEMDELGLVAVLHDMGKIAIPDDILKKPGKLTEEEWEEMKKHPAIGYRIAESSNELSYIADAILHHHEHWDGSGYPKGLKGEEIPKLSRILSLVDTYDAITNDRIYREAMSHEEAIEEIKRCAGTQFDPALVKVFVEIVGH